MTTTKRATVAELRKRVKVAEDILRVHLADAQKLADEAKAKSVEHGDYYSQDARCFRHQVSAYRLSLHALWLATQGEFGEDLPDTTETAATP